LRYAILSDVHANIEALEAVLEAARAEGADRVLCLGDVVGYHADPDACVARLREVSALCVAGNHDRAAVGVTGPTDFSDAGWRAILWTRARLAPESRSFLAALPLHAVVDGRLLLVHAAVHPAPNADLHLSNDARVSRSIQALYRGPWGVRLGFFGHTHRGAVHELRGGAQRTREGTMIALDPGSHYLINPGSVGQPRDGDPRASFLILDTDELGVRFHRVPFDGAACLAKAARAGLLDPPRPPSVLAKVAAGLRRVARRPW
jgi:predicted phosphodiesterase